MSLAPGARTIELRAGLSASNLYTLNVSSGLYCVVRGEEQ